MGLTTLQKTWANSGALSLCIPKNIQIALNIEAGDLIQIDWGEVVKIDQSKVYKRGKKKLADVLEENTNKIEEEVLPEL